MKIMVEKIDGYWQWSTILSNGNKLIVVLNTHAEETPAFDRIAKTIQERENDPR